MKSNELARRDLIAAGSLSIGMALAARIEERQAQAGRFLTTRLANDTNRSGPP